MKTLINAEQFQCEYCHRIFYVKDYKTVEQAIDTCTKHEDECGIIPVIHLGDVATFKDYNNNYQIIKNNSTYITCPLYIKKVKKEKDTIYYHCSFVKIDYINKLWIEDKLKTAEWFRDSKQKYFIFEKHQINSKINMKDLFNTFDYLNEIKQNIDFKNRYSDRDATAIIEPLYLQEKLQLTIQIPYKTEYPIINN